MARNLRQNFVWISNKNVPNIITFTIFFKDFLDFRFVFIFDAVVALLFSTVQAIRQAEKINPLKADGESDSEGCFGRT